MECRRASTSCPATSSADACGLTVTTSSSPRSADMRVSVDVSHGEQDVEDGDVAEEPAVTVDDGHRVEVDAVGPGLGEPVDDLLDLLPGLGRDERRRHDAAGLVLLVAEQLAQRQRRHGGDVAQHLAPHGEGQVAQRVDRLVGLHGGQQARRLDRIRLAQQLLEVLGLHLLEGVGRLVRAQRGQQLATLVTPQVLEQVGQLAGAQAVQALVGRLEADVRRRTADVLGRLGEGLNGGPVDDAVGRGRGRHRRGPRRRSSVALDTSAPTSRMRPMHLGQVEVGGPDDLHALDVDELVVEDVFGQEHLAGAPDDVAQVEPGRAEDHLGVADPVDGRGRDEGEPAADPDDQTAHGRVHLAVGPAGHDVVQPADLLAGLVPHRAAEQAGQRHDGVEDPLGREDAPRAAAALVRRAFRVAGTTGDQT